MASIGNYTVRIRVDEDYLRLTAYRAALQAIAEGDPDRPWARSDEAEFAEGVLRTMGEWEEPTTSEGG